jgi:ABC-type Mn2+/Zn2+ transport system permease subunit
LIHALADPWTHSFLQRALLELVLVSIVAAPLGCWVVLRRLSYSTESLAHALFPGLVIAALTGVPLLLGGAAGVLVAALSIAVVSRVRTIGTDTAVAIVITSLFGLGVLLALSPASPPGLQELLFGDPLGVTRRDLVQTAVLAGVAVAALRALHRPLLAVAFDRSTAPALGVRPSAVDTALLALVALAVLIGVQALGTLLVVAVVVAPAATARTLTSGLRTMMLCSFAVAVGAAIAGIYVSYYAETAAGASIAATLVIAYALAYAARALGDKGRDGRVSPAASAQR